ncbi:hypothetical protein JTP77_043565, partial [Streptomyces sp. S9]|nr:hypothetical protein [Streptomyces sp. S9]
MPHDYQQGSFPPATGQGAGAGYAAQGAPVSQVEVAAMAAELAELRTQLHAWREGLVKGSGLPPGHQPQRTMAQRRELRVDEVVGMASLLQPEPPDAFARALAVSGR